MYLDFYALKKVPFHITPDPEFLFLSPSHKTALGSLIYGIEERQGFVVLIGEVGVGKTTILRAYLERVDLRQLKTIYIFHSNVTFLELLKTIHREFGHETVPEDVFEAVNNLHQILMEEYRQGRNITLIVDEAQNMPIETLEHLRMLSNLETSTQKLIQIVLAGQPEFEDKLNLHELRQLRQRVVVRSTILPLTNEESLAYIQHRLAKASVSDSAVFTKAALRLIIKSAQGIPRVLNVLCTNALISGFGYQTPHVTTKIAKEVIADYVGKKRLTLFRPWLLVSIGAAALLALLWFSPVKGMVLPKIERFYRANIAEKFSARPDTLSPPATRLAKPARQLPKPQQPSESRRPQQNPTRVSTTKPPQMPRPAAEGLTSEAGSKMPQPVLPRVFSAPQQVPTPMPNVFGEQTPAAKANVEPTTPPSSSSTQPSPVQERVLVQQPPARVTAESTAQPPVVAERATTAAGEERVDVVELEETRSVPTITIQRGDRMSALALRAYGRVTSEVFDWIRLHNPHIRNLNHIEVGEVITLPPLETSP